MFRQKDTLDMHVCSKKYFTKYIYVCLGSKIPWICMYVAKNTSQNVYMYVQVARYLGYACIQQNTSQKYTYVQVAKYLMKKKTTENKKDINNKGCLAKKQHACEKDNFQLFFERFY